MKTLVTHAVTATCLLALVAVGSVLMFAYTAPDSDAAVSTSVVQVEPHTHMTAHLRITSVRNLWGGRFYVTMSNGSAYRAGPCVEEDSTNCYWDAETAGLPGSGGYSFIDLNRRAYYVGK